MKKLIIALAFGVVALNAYALTAKVGDVTWTYSVLTDVSGAQYVQLGDGSNPGCIGASGEVVIPDVIEGLPVRKLGVNLFNGNSQITRVVIPDSVSVVSGAFKGCANLESVELHDGIYAFENSAFNNCVKLRNLTSRGGNAAEAENYLTSTQPIVGEKAFCNCISLTNLPVGVLADKVSIGNNAFQHCSNITSVVFGNRLKTIGVAAFQMDWLNDNYFRTGFKNLVFPASLEHIGNSAFQNINSITNLVFKHPAAITNIGSAAFHRFSLRYNYTFRISGLYRLQKFSGDAFCDTYITGIDDMMLSGIKEIGGGAFSWCGRLKNIKIPASITNLSQIGTKPFHHTGITNIAIHADSPLLNNFAATVLKLTNEISTASICKITTYTGYCAMKETVVGIEWVYLQDGEGKTWVKWPAEGQALPESLIVPETLGGNNVYGIMECGFNNLADVKCVKLPMSVKEVGVGAFCGCTSLEKIRVFSTSSEIISALRTEYGEERIEPYQNGTMLFVR